MLDALLAKARDIVALYGKVRGDMAARDILNFFGKHAYAAIPAPGKNVISCGSWLVSRTDSKGPRNIEEALAALGLVVCFSDDPIPFIEGRQIRQSAERAISGCIAFCSRKIPAVVLSFCDHLTIEDMAFLLLHEIRHLRQRYGLTLAQLPLLDSEESHEGATWLFMYDLLDVWGGNLWRAAVEQELNWLQRILQDMPGEQNAIQMAKSGLYYRELDQVFGVSPHRVATILRGTLVSIRASILHAERRGVERLHAAQTVVRLAYDYIEMKRKSAFS